MGKYTVYDQPRVDGHIQEHLDIAVEELAKLPGVISIMLTGGFGRGEGSVSLEDQKSMPVNDYDVYIIVKEKISEELINETAKKVEARAGSRGYSLYEHSEKDFYFDIRQMAFDKLEKLPNLIKYYELKHGSHVLYGQDLREKMLGLDGSCLPISDGLRFLLNRISHILEWFSIRYLTKGKIADWEEKTLIYDISKTYIECCTILSLIGGFYQQSYQKRLEGLKNHVKLFDDLWQENPGLLEKIEYFTWQKLRPNFAEIKDVPELWFQTRDYALSVLEYVLEKQFGNKNIAQFYFKPYLEDFLKKKYLGLFSMFLLPSMNTGVQKFLNLVWFFRILKFRKIAYTRLLFQFSDPGLKIFQAALFIIRSLNKDKSINQEMMARGIKILKGVYPFSVPEMTLEGYENLRKIYSDAWRLYYFQKLI